MNVIIGNKNFNGELMSTPDELEKGMMGRTSLDGCMIFKMGKGHHSFWMKGCLIALDIVFVLNNRITKIHHNCPAPDPHRITLPRYTGLGDHVLEFPAGTAKDWKIGDKVSMYLGTPQNPVS